MIFQRRLRKVRRIGMITALLVDIALIKQVAGTTGHSLRMPNPASQIEPLRSTQS